MFHEISVVKLAHYISLIKGIQDPNVYLLDRESILLASAYALMLFWGRIDKVRSIMETIQIPQGVY